MSDARPHHYLFAHRVLPQLAFSDPDWFVAQLREGGLSFLEFFWNGVAADLPEPQRLDTQDLGVTWSELASDVTIACVAFPPPVEIPEAFYAGFLHRPRRRSLFRQRPAFARYITLELGINIATGTPRTVLGEWDAKGVHGNMGSGPAPDRDSFLQAVSRFGPG